MYIFHHFTLWHLLVSPESSMHWLFVAVHTCTNFVYPYVLPSSLLVISAMELALALEKLVNEKLHNLHSVRYSPVMQ